METLKTNARQEKKREKGNMRNISKSNRKLNPQNSTADRQQRLRIASLVRLTHTRQRFDWIEI